MSTTMSLRVRARYEKACQMVADLCKPRTHPEHRDWTMSIPARPDYDPDLVISDSLKDIPRLLDEVEALRARAERAEMMCVALRNALDAMGVTFSANETRLAAVMIGGKPVDHYPDMEARIERIAAVHARRLQLIAADDPGAQIRQVVDAARRFVQALDATEASIRPDPEGVIDGPHGQALRAAVAALDAT